MKQMKIIFFVLLFFNLISSCKPIVKTIYGVNKKIAFSNKKDYLKYVQKKYRFNVNNLYYADEKGYDNFMNSIAQNHVDYFYGIFLNDSIKVKKSMFLSENESCRGRILNEMNSVSKNIASENTEKDNVFSINTFYNVSTNKPLNFKTGSHKKLVLIFSYKFGQLREKDFEEIENLVNQNKEYDLYIISADRIYDLK